MKKLLGVIVLALMASACKKTTVVYVPGPGPGPGPTPIPSRMWYDVYGSLCGSLKPGCTYVDSGATSRKAMWFEDFDYSPGAAAVWATVYDTDLGYYVQAYGYFGRTGVFYDANTGRAINEEGSEESRDVLTSVGAREEEVVAKAGALLAERHDLEPETALNIARALNDWNKIAKSRERTQADLEVFTKRIYGVDLKAVNAAIEAEDEKAQDDLVASAAKTWNTSAENMKRILVEQFAE